MPLAIFLIVITPYTVTLPILYMSYRVISQRLTIQKNPWNIGLLLLFVWSLFVGILNKSILSVLGAIVILLYFGVNIYMQSYFKEEGKVEKLLKYTLYFSSLAAMFGIVEKFIFMKSNETFLTALLGVASKATIGHRIYSTFGNPNVAGHWFAVMVLLCLYFLKNTMGNEKLLHKLMLFLFLIALCLTGSRGAYIGLLAALPVFYVFNKDKKDSLLIGFMIVLLIVLIFLPQHTSTLGNITGHKLERSMVTRDMIWEGSYKMIKLKPITGWGLLGFIQYGSKFISYDGPVLHAHNLWINFLATVGIFGFLIYLYMKYHIYKSLWVLFKRNSKLFSLLAAIQVLILGHGIVDVTLFAPQPGIIYICSSAIICSLAAQRTFELENNSLLDQFKSLSKTG